MNNIDHAVLVVNEIIIEKEENISSLAENFYVV